MHCSQIKAVPYETARLLQPLPIPGWKWEEISMDFITGLPMTPQGHDSIWVIVDRLTKLAHFIPVKTTDRVVKYVKLYVSQIMRLHVIPMTIISYQGL